jgi:small subunit ribosomal protein S21
VRHAKFGKPRGRRELPPWHSSIAVMTRTSELTEGQEDRRFGLACHSDACRQNSTRRPLRSSSTNVRHERNNILQVFVRDNNVDQALKVLKRRLQREGVFREMKRRRFYEKPSERSARERGEAVRRIRKLKRKQAQREGLLPPPKKKVVAGGLRGRPGERRPAR